MTMNNEIEDPPINEGRMQGRAPIVAAVSWWVVAVLLTLGAIGFIASAMLMVWKVPWAVQAIWTCVWIVVLGAVLAGLRENLFGQSGKPWDGHEG